MADTYWDHSSRREIKRLIDLGDAGAILDELQNQTTEWDDAREALDHLVRGPRAEVERLRAELDTDRQALDRAAADHAQLRVEQVETRHDRDRLAEQVKQLRALTQDEDGNVLPPESELPVGVFYGVLYGAEGDQ